MLSHRSLAVSAGLVLMIAAATPGRAGPQREEIRLADVRWQALRADVGGVHVGPDGRAWFHMRDLGPALSLEQLKAAVAAEFDRPDPQVPERLGVALFEPGGRVWFTHVDFQALRDGERAESAGAKPARSAGRLLGYDGKAWIEREGPPGVYAFWGRHPAHTSGRLGGNHAFVGGRAFFATLGTVLSFDGRDWDTHELWTRLQVQSTEYAAALYPEPDGKGLVTHVPLSPTTVWRWREGRWSRLRLPEPLASAGHVLAIAPTASGAWVEYVTRRDQVGLAFVPFGGAVAPEREGESPVERLIRELGAQEFATRQEASRELKRLGKAVVPDLRRALERTTDPEARARLERALASATAPAAEGEGAEAPPPPARVGSYLVDEAVFLCGDGRGGVIAGGRKLTTRDGREIGAGVVASPATGEAVLLDEGAAALAGWRNARLPVARSAVPVVAAPGRLIWTPGDGVQTPPTLIDLEARRVVGALPAADYVELHAALPDGTLFASTGWRGPVMAYRPRSRDNVAVLKVEPVPLAAPTHAVDDTGLLWAQDAASRALRTYDGRAWREVTGLAPDERVVELLPGRGGTMIVGIEGRGGAWALRVPKKDPTDPVSSLAALVERHREAVAAAFAGAPGGLVPNISGTGLTNRSVLVADKSGNVWVLTRDQPWLRIRCGDRWVDPRPALQAAGLRRGYAAFAAAVGDGSKVYLSDFGLRHDGGRSVLARVVDDDKLDDARRVAAEDAPHGLDQKLMRWPVIDGGGGLWVAATRGRGLGSSDLITGRGAVRLTERGVSAEFDGLWPAGADGAGGAWLGRAETGGRADPPYALWRDGRAAGAAPVAAGARVFPGGKGAIFAWVAAGIRRFVEDPARPGDYRPGEPYTVPGFDRPLPFTPSRLGFLVVSPTHFADNAKLQIVHLPPRK